MERTFTFYSVLKNEDATPYVGHGILAVADGLGGSGSTVHVIDDPARETSLMASAYSDFEEGSEVADYIRELLKPMADDINDTSALWASRIVIGRCVYALTEGAPQAADLSDSECRKELSDFILAGLHETARRFNLQCGKHSGQLILPTTLALIRYVENKKSVKAEVVWAGDSRCYAITKDGLKRLSDDDEDESGAINNLFYADNEGPELRCKQYDIEKPCILFAVSDGIFDPFDPVEDLGVEYTLLGAVEGSTSFDGLSERLKSIYDSIGGDDATMAAAVFGFEDYEGLKKCFKDRYEKIDKVWSEYLEKRVQIEVLGRPEEEMRRYIRQRTCDKYLRICEELARNVSEVGGTDIAVPKSIVDKRRGSLNGEIAGYIQEHPAVTIVCILPPEKGRDGKDLCDCYKALKQAAGKWEKANDVLQKSYQKSKNLDEQKEKLMASVIEQRGKYKEPEKADFSRELTTYQSEQYGYYLAWKDAIGQLDDKPLKENDKSLKKNDKSLKENKKERKVTNQRLNEMVNKYLRERKRNNNDIKTQENSTNEKLSKYQDALAAFQEALSGSGKSLLDVIDRGKLGETSFGGSAVADETAACAAYEDVLGEMAAHQEIYVEEIVDALAAHCDRMSVIDKFYSGSRMEEFRTYYRTKSDRQSAEKFKTELEELNKEYLLWLQAK